MSDETTSTKSLQQMSLQEREQRRKQLGQEIADSLNYNALIEAAKREKDPVKQQENEQKAAAILEKYKKK